MYQESVSTQCIDHHWRKYTISLTCDFQGYRTDLFFSIIILREKLCIYHEAKKLYLDHMHEEYMDGQTRIKDIICPEISRG